MAGILTLIVATAAVVLSAPALLPPLAALQDATAADDALSVRPAPKAPAMVPPPADLIRVECSPDVCSMAGTTSVADAHHPKFAAALAEVLAEAKKGAPLGLALRSSVPADEAATILSTARATGRALWVLYAKDAPNPRLPPWPKDVPAAFGEARTKIAANPEDSVEPVLELLLQAHAAHPDCAPLATAVRTALKLEGPLMWSMLDSDLTRAGVAATLGGCPLTTDAALLLLRLAATKGRDSLRTVAACALKPLTKPEAPDPCWPYSHP